MKKCLNPIISTGLLAGLWEFPSLLLEEKNPEVKQRRALCAELSKLLGTNLTESFFQYVGEVSSMCMDHVLHTFFYAK